MLDPSDEALSDRTGGTPMKLTLVVSPDLWIPAYLWDLLSCSSFPCLLPSRLFGHFSPLKISSNFMPQFSCPVPWKPLPAMLICSSPSQHMGISFNVNCSGFPRAPTPFPAPPSLCHRILLDLHPATYNHLNAPHGCISLLTAWVFHQESHAIIRCVHCWSSPWTFPGTG